MNRLLSVAALLALLAACDNAQPFSFTTDTVAEPDPGVEEPDDDPVNDAGVPESVGANVETATYRPGGNFLSVQITSLDSTPVNAQYDRNPALDVPGYRAFSVQEDKLDRMFIAMAQRSADGRVTGVLAMDGGQFNKFFGGVFYERTGNYSPHNPSQPDRGLVSYAGNYAGLQNLAAPRPNEALPVGPNIDPALIPRQPARVEGKVFLNADFADNTVNGAVYDRSMPDFGDFELEDIFLVVTEIDEDGRFNGDVEDIEQKSIGSWAGIFGGTQASSVAGGLNIEDFIDDVENEQEFGLFVLSKCGTQGDTAICEQVRPFN